MSLFSLRLGSKAMEDIEATVEWLAARSISGANSWVKALDEAKVSIARAPLSFSRSHEARRLRRDLREAYFSTKRGKTYRIVFLIDGDHVVVLRVRGSGQPNLGADDL